jgi:hypothetical protein
VRGAVVHASDGGGRGAGGVRSADAVHVDGEGATGVSSPFKRECTPTNRVTCALLALTGSQVAFDTLTYT